MPTHMTGAMVTNSEPPPMPARKGAWAIYQTFATADGTPLFIGVTSDQQWTRFVQEFSLQDLAADPRLATNAMRAAERPWLLPALAEIIKTIPYGEGCERCERAAVSWSPVAKPTDLFHDAHLQASGRLLDRFVSRLGGWHAPHVARPSLPGQFGGAR